MAHASRGDHDRFEPLQVAVFIGDEAAIVVASGELDVFSVPRLKQAAYDARNSQAGRIVLDLAGLSFVDVVGLNALVGIGRDCREHGKAFSVRHPSRAVRRIGELAGIEETVLPTDAEPGSAERR